MSQPSCTSTCPYGMLWASLREYVSVRLFVTFNCSIIALISLAIPRTAFKWNSVLSFCIILQPVKSSSHVTMENLPVNNRNGQAYGYTLYETVITAGGSLMSGDNIRDRALVSPCWKWWSNSLYSHSHLFMNISLNVALQLWLLKGKQISDYKNSTMCWRGHSCSTTQCCH